MDVELLNRLDRIERTLQVIVERESKKEHYSTVEFAAIVGRSEFTCREWCRLGRLNANKKKSGRGQHFSWVISHEELLRYRRDGLLPVRKLA